jgi:hypothetical protein
VDREEERATLPEYLPVLNERLEEGPDATGTVPELPHKSPATDNGVPTSPVWIEEDFTPEAAWEAPGESGDGKAATEPADPNGATPPLTTPHEQNLGPSLAVPTEPSHNYQIPLPDDLGVGELEPGDGISRIFGPPPPGQVRIRMPLSIGSSPDAQNDREQTVPNIVVTVILGHSRDMFEQAVEVAIQRATQAFHKIAKQEIDMFAFEQRAARRAADYRLRGPNPQ